MRIDITPKFDPAVLLHAAADMLEDNESPTMLRALYDVASNVDDRLELTEYVVRYLGGAITPWESKWYRTKGAKVRALRQVVKILDRTVV